MDNLFFYTSLGLITYYFLVYAKPTRPDPKPTQNQSTQTEPLISGPEAIPDPEVTKQLEAENQALLQDQAQKEHTIQGLNQSYEKLEVKKNKEIGSLEKQMATLKQQVSQLSQAQKTQQTSTQQEQKELEQTLDQLIKGMDDLNKDLDKM